MSSATTKDIVFEEVEVRSLAAQRKASHSESANLTWPSKTKQKMTAENNNKPTKQPNPTQPNPKIQHKNPQPPSHLAHVARIPSTSCHRTMFRSRDPSQVLPSEFYSWPFQGWKHDLHVGNQSVTWKKLDKNNWRIILPNKLTAKTPENQWLEERKNPFGSWPIHSGMHMYIYIYISSFWALTTHQTVETGKLVTLLWVH